MRTAPSAPSAPVGLQAYGEPMSRCSVAGDSLTKALPVSMPATHVHQGNFTRAISEEVHWY